MQQLLAMAAIEMANQNWKVGRLLFLEQFGVNLSRGSCLNNPVNTGAAFAPVEVCSEAGPEASGQGV